MHKLYEHFTTLYGSKMEIFRFFFDILSIHNDEISYVKHVFDPHCVVFSLFGCLEGAEVASKGLGHNGTTTRHNALVTLFDVGFAD